MVARAILALLVAGVLSSALTPLAMRVAYARGFVDRPGGWKTHGHATPLLGGAAALLALLPPALVFGDDRSRLVLALAPAVLLCIVGTIDDLRNVSVRLRLLGVGLAGVALWAGDLGWNLGVAWWINLLLTVFWVIGIVNAINLLDLMDGVAGSVVVAITLSAGVLALHRHQATVGILGFATAGGILGFLRYNTARPARIFLGDGGSMPLGLLCAVGTMGALRSTGDGSGLCAGLLIMGFPLLDMGFRIVLRLSRGISLLTAGSDSLVNRARERTSSELAVALLAGAIQLALGSIAIAALSAGSATVVTVFAATVVMGIVGATAIQYCSATWLHQSRTQSMTPATLPELSEHYLAKAYPDSEQQHSHTHMSQMRADEG